ncbi:unnamed protein product, partial [Choristocarpus tenellus]
VQRTPNSPFGVTSSLMMAKNLNNRARCYFKLGKMTEALGDCSQVTSLDDVGDQEKATAVYVRSEVLQKLGRKEEAQKDLLQAAALGHSEAKTRLARRGKTSTRKRERASSTDQRDSPSQDSRQGQQGEGDGTREGGMSTKSNVSTMMDGDGGCHNSQCCDPALDQNQNQTQIVSQACAPNPFGSCNGSQHTPNPSHSLGQDLGRTKGVEYIGDCSTEGEADRFDGGVGDEAEGCALGDIDTHMTGLQGMQSGSPPALVSFSTSFSPGQLPAAQSPAVAHPSVRCCLAATTVADGTVEAGKCLESWGMNSISRDVEKRGEHGGGQGEERREVSLPPPDVQAENIRWLFRQAEDQMSEGDVWFVVNRKWWLAWRRHVGCEEGDPCSGDPPIMELGCGGENPEQGPGKGVVKVEEGQGAQGAERGGGKDANGLVGEVLEAEDEGGVGGKDKGNGESEIMVSDGEGQGERVKMKEKDGDGMVDVESSEGEGKREGCHCGKGGEESRSCSAQGQQEKGIFVEGAGGIEAHSNGGCNNDGHSDESDAVKVALDCGAVSRVGVEGSDGNVSVKSCSFEGGANPTLCGDQQRGQGDRAVGDEEEVSRPEENCERGDIGANHGDEELWSASGIVEKEGRLGGGGGNEKVDVVAVDTGVKVGTDSELVEGAGAVLEVGSNEVAGTDLAEGVGGEGVEGIFDDGANQEGIGAVVSAEGGCKVGVDVENGGSNCDDTHPGADAVAAASNSGVVGGSVAPGHGSDGNVSGSISNDVCDGREMLPPPRPKDGPVPDVEVDSLPPPVPLSTPAPTFPSPGPIDNSSLVLEAGAPGTVAGTGRRLRLHLVRGFHFEMVPQEVWRALHAW